jgi:hypothetical protein
MAGGVKRVGLCQIFKFTTWNFVVIAVTIRRKTLSLFVLRAT